MVMVVVGCIKGAVHQVPQYGTVCSEMRRQVRPWLSPEGWVSQEASTLLFRTWASMAMAHGIVHPPRNWAPWNRRLSSVLILAPASWLAKPYNPLLCIPYNVSYCTVLRCTAMS